MAEPRQGAERYSVRCTHTPTINAKLDSGKRVLTASLPAMARKKQRRFGNPVRQAALDDAAREQARAAESARLAAARERAEGGCAEGCGCGDSCCA